MGATVAERQGLQAAIARALAKERANAVEEPKKLYVANFRIGRTVKKVQHSDFDTFEKIVTEFSQSFPNVPVDLFSVTEAK